VLGEVRMLEKHKVIISSPSGDGVPYRPQRLFEILRFDDDLEDPMVVRPLDTRVG
jgi:hypothetical protein